MVGDASVLHIGDVPLPVQADKIGGIASNNDKLWVAAYGSGPDAYSIIEFKMVMSASSP